MKIDLQYDKVKIAIDFDDFQVERMDDVILVMDKVRAVLQDCIQWAQGSLEKPAPVIPSLPTQAPVVPVQAPPRDSFGIRERLPNNLVDVKDLNVQQAVTENALVRCPACGQAHALVVHSDNAMFLMRKDYLKNEFGIVQEFECPPDQTFVQNCRQEKEFELDYFYRLQDMPLQPDVDFAVNNDTEVFCPVCQKSHPFMNWKEAWDTPLHYFEHEDICEACGGELLTNVSKNDQVKQCNTCKRRHLDAKGELNNVRSQ